mgnify:CR=1 FL=1
MGVWNYFATKEILGKTTDVLCKFLMYVFHLRISDNKMIFTGFLLFGVCFCGTTNYNITDEIVTVAWNDVNYTQAVLHG